MCLVTFWKCYFPPPPTQNPPPQKPPKHHHPHHHDNKKNQIHTKIKIAQRERSVRGFPAKSKALSRRRSRRFVGQRLCVHGWSGLWVRRRSRKLVRGTKALGRRRSWRLVVAGNGLSLSLSLCVFQKMRFEGKIKTEMTLHPTHSQTEKHFRKMYFPCAIKHLHLRKSISGNHFHPKQTQSQSQFLFYPKYIILPVSPKKHFLQITFNEVPMINNVV